jgi:hypothetical protein
MHNFAATITPASVELNITHHDHQISSVGLQIFLRLDHDMGGLRGMRPDRS